MNTLSFRVPQLLSLAAVVWNLVLISACWLLLPPVDLNGFMILGLAQLPLAWFMGKYLQGYLLNYIDHARRLEKGDLTIQMPTNSICWCFNSLASSLNKGVAGLNAITRNVVSSGKAISGGVDNIQSNASQVAQILDRHVTETDQLVTAAHQMSATADAAAGDAAAAARASEDASTQGSQARRAVEEAVGNIEALSAEVKAIEDNIHLMSNETKRIEKVLSVIGGIAEQTNLLALNAAIEAARAGEQGRGFAVVADEVRSLAAKTQNSTVEIGEMLSTLQQSATNLEKAMAQTRTTFETTNGSVTAVHTQIGAVLSANAEIGNLNDQMAAAAEEQSAVAQQVSQSISALRDMAVRLQDLNRQAGEAPASVRKANDFFMKETASFTL